MADTEFERAILNDKTQALLDAIAMLDPSSLEDLGINSLFL
jgi:hypothetical protein